MHILIYSAVYPPEVRSASFLMFELGETLKNKGHKVTVITSIPMGGPAKSKRLIDKFYKKEENDGIRVIRISTIPIHKTRMSAFLRGLGQSLNSLLFFLIGLFLRSIDISLSYSPPLTLGLTGFLLRITKGVPHILNVQDLVPQYAIDLGVLTNKKLIRLIKFFEHFIYNKVECITVHSKGNKDYIVKEGIDPKKVQIIPNWVDTRQIAPSERQNKFRTKHGLEEKFLVLFAGVLGFAQDLDTVVESASFLRGKENIIILIVGDGVEKEDWCKKRDHWGLQILNSYLSLQRKNIRK